MEDPADLLGRHVLGPDLAARLPHQVFKVTPPVPVFA